jgi:hypothetical protein
MITRSLFSLCFVVASAAMPVDRSSAGDVRASQCSRAPADRCLMTSPETIVYGSMSDHGPGYDAQGNVVDRHGNVVAVPGNRGGEVREVFVREPRR